MPAPISAHATMHMQQQQQAQFLPPPTPSSSIGLHPRSALSALQDHSINIHLLSEKMSFHLMACLHAAEQQQQQNGQQSKHPICTRELVEAVQAVMYRALVTATSECVAPSSAPLSPHASIGRYQSPLKSTPATPAMHNGVGAAYQQQQQAQQPQTFLPASTPTQPMFSPVSAAAARFTTPTKPRTPVGMYALTAAAAASTPQQQQQQQSSEVLGTPQPNPSLKLKPTPQPDAASSHPIHALTTPSPAQARSHSSAASSSASSASSSVLRMCSQGHSSSSIDDRTPHSASSSISNGGSIHQHELLMHSPIQFRSGASSTTPGSANGNNTSSSGHKQQQHVSFASSAHSPIHSASASPHPTRVLQMQQHPHHTPRSAASASMVSPASVHATPSGLLARPSSAAATPASSAPATPTRKTVAQHPPQQSRQEPQPAAAVASAPVVSTPAAAAAAVPAPSSSSRRPFRSPETSESDTDDEALLDFQMRIPPSPLQSATATAGASSVTSSPLHLQQQPRSQQFQPSPAAVSAAAHSYRPASASKSVAAAAASSDSHGSRTAARSLSSSFIVASASSSPLQASPAMHLPVTPSASLLSSQLRYDRHKYSDVKRSLASASDDSELEESDAESGLTPRVYHAASHDYSSSDE